MKINLRDWSSRHVSLGHWTDGSKHFHLKPPWALTRPFSRGSQFWQVTSLPCIGHIDPETTHQSFQDFLFCPPQRAPELTSSLSIVVECYSPLWHVMDMPWPHDICCLQSNFLTMRTNNLLTLFCLKEPTLCYRNKYEDCNNYRLLRSKAIWKASTNKKEPVLHQLFNITIYLMRKICVMVSMILTEPEHRI